MNLNIFNMVLAGFMIVMCLVFAYYLQFTELIADRLYGNNRMILTGVLILYAAFRSYRLYKAIQQHNKQEEE